MVLTGLGAALTWVIVLIGVGMAVGGLAGETAVTAASPLGQLVQGPFSILSSLVGVLFVAVPALHDVCGETITIQAAFSELLRRRWPITRVWSADSPQSLGTPLFSCLETQGNPGVPSQS